MILDKVKNAYIMENLEDMEHVKDRLYHFIDGNSAYYYKDIVTDHGIGLQPLMHEFDQNRMIASEVVNSKFAKYFDVKCPEYKVAYFPENETYGVFSRDMNDLYGWAGTLREYLEAMKRHRYIRSMKQIKDFSRRKLKPIFEDLDKTALFHCATGQRDGHTSNIMVHNSSGNMKKPVTGLTLIDNGYSYPAIYEDIDQLKKAFKTASGNIDLLTSINSYFGNYCTLTEFYKDIGESEYISTKAIGTHLNNAYNAIDRGVMFQIRDEIIDEYKIIKGTVPDVILQHVANCNEVVLEETTKGIESSYRIRQHIMQ